MKEEKVRILKMVEEGKLKVDEAITLLDELDIRRPSSEVFRFTTTSSIHLGYK